MGKIVLIKKPSDPRLKKIAADLANGALVVFPTETVYGLGANALDDSAVKRIFWAKNRPADNPLIVHISDKKQLRFLAIKTPKKAERLMKRFWPGPLTLVLKKKKKVPSVVTAGLPTIGIRMPSHSIARKLIELAHVPIAAPSANTAGKPSATRAFHARLDLLSRVDWVIDSGPSRFGLESTIIDCTPKTPVLLRPGAVSVEQLEKTIGKIRIFRFGRKKIVAKAPGMKHRHYAPRARVVLVESKKIDSTIKKFKRKMMVLTVGKKISTTKNRIAFNFRFISGLAKELFACFRLADQKKVSNILVEKPLAKGIGRALLNRLEKAAAKR